MSHAVHAEVTLLCCEGLLMTATHTAQSAAGLHCTGKCRGRLGLICKRHAHKWHGAFASLSFPNVARVGTLST